VASTYSASAYRKLSQKAVETKASSTESRQGERRERLVKLLTDYRDLILSQLPSTDRVQQAANRGHSWMTVHYAHPPSKQYPAELTHFSGCGQDPRSGGIPQVSMIQGFRPHGPGAVPDPRSLPDGQTVVDHLNAWALSKVENPKDAVAFRTFFRRAERRGGRWNIVNKVEIHMIWDLPKWEAHCAQLEQQRQERNVRHRGGGRGGGGASGQPSAKSYEQFTAEQESQREAAHQKWDKMNKVRRRAARNDESESE
jgi:hypothetical protein